jgi:hypothetical protein
MCFRSKKRGENRICDSRKVTLKIVNKLGSLLRNSNTIPGTITENPSPLSEDFSIINSKFESTGQARDSYRNLKKMKKETT